MGGQDVFLVVEDEPKLENYGSALESSCFDVPEGVDWRPHESR
jgi:hypothetical protein